MPRFLTVGAAQIHSATGDIDANLDKHREMIARARSAGVDVLIFPELSLVGHYGAERLLDVCMPRGDDRLTALSQEAGEMEIVVGFVEEATGAQFYNAAAVLRAGRLCYIHRKINLPSYGRLIETKYYAHGRFVDTHRRDDDWIMGLLICADLYNPALAHLSFLHGATYLCAPISSGREAVGDDFDNPRSWATTIQFYAMMYGAPVIMVNRVGREGDLTFWGGSRILDAYGRVLAQAGGHEELITARLDYADTRKARAMLPTVRDSNLALVQRETNRLIERLGVPDMVRDES
ncbi:Glutamine amidotransferase chain of NAD synthetase [Rhodovulum sp. P5]|uniref:nitrilase-related carbon-nitrogen hydrolase n=1 Tax=Rhodovulum sp. P5 TaxID=1564506 RepID=UPI0009C2A50A|nr:nitrilase-related carbon-nitrogen hydrolase [Rhodovulum sp. P5]ARE40140.1 Glutamine amidotransferase chain of NAD synthetase [Rhodovulum sp. P5]